MPPDMAPIIHAGAFELCVIHAESQRFDQVQFGVSGGAQSSNVARIGRNFRLNENNMHRAEFGYSSREDRGGADRRAVFPR